MDNEINILLDNKNITNKISDWSLYTKENKVMVKITYLSGKKFFSDLDKVTITPSLFLGKNQSIEINNVTIDNINSAKIIGNKYILLYYQNNNKPYLYNINFVKIINIQNNKYKNILDYFYKVAKLKDELGGIDKKIAPELKKLKISSSSVLSAYLSGKSNLYAENNQLIYPFGMNISQMNAIKKAFTSQVSIIEGPPGTGKTQTILNLIANILISGKKVLITSNNDMAVKNIVEKLEDYNLGFIVAQLGSNKRRETFFEKELEIPDLNTKIQDKRNFFIELNKKNSQIYDLFNLDNKLKLLESELKELETEKEYLEMYIGKDFLEPKKFKIFKDTSKKTIDLISLFDITAIGKIKILEKLKLLFNYGIYSFKDIENLEKKEEIISFLKINFYDLKIKEINNEIFKIKKQLENNNFSTLRESITTDSMNYFKYWLKKNISNQKFNDNNYKKNDINFKNFLSRFPVIISTAYSALSSIKKGFLLDYLIIDEASQLEIIPGILAMGCVKNLIIVGDSKQLHHIPLENNLNITDERYDYTKNSMLDSVIKVFNSEVPRTLLKEHYRCNPMIINFCNQQFYNNELIIMTKNLNKNPLIKIETAKGNHMRFSENGRINLREIQSLFEKDISDKFSYNDIGFISPYRAQVNESNNFFDNNKVKMDTIHKFQGRECDTIIFSTVLDKKSNKKSLDFVDNNELINVAVSRAKKQFVLVTNNEVFENNKKSLAALTRYMKYYTKECLIHRSKVISNFDLLYKEYDKSLEKRKQKLISKDSKYMSERIIASVLRDILNEADFKCFIFHQQIKLKLLIDNISDLTEEEKLFIKRNSSCDFVIYFKVGKQPIGVIEVDGYAFHNNEKQRKRDSLKNSILNKAGLEICRLSTIQSGEEEKIKTFLKKLISI
ncbi:DUF2726 domain-containing protein [Clostridium perfringens]|nr:DUF2726 domain-containing protein [Clostridium perfringens]